MRCVVRVPQNLKSPRASGR